jgi:hypothetical protein
MEVSGQQQVPTVLTPGKEARHPLNRRLGGPQSLFGCSEEEKSPLALAET